MPAILLDDGRSVSYRVRESRRSQRVRLTLNPRDGLVLVTPPGQDPQWLEELADSWKGWISEQLDAMDIDLPPDGKPTYEVPVRIDLPALSECWHVQQRYAPSGKVSARSRGTGSILLVRGRGDDERACQALKRWLARRARETLPQMLDAVARETGLEYRNVSVRSQRSRWGSCSSRGDVSLNQQLLFLPAEWVRHILVHELCHTLELNHSDRFWAHVARFDPEYRQLRAEVRNSWGKVPHWALG